MVAVTVDPPSTNRKISKKSRIQFPVLSDEAGEWMLAYRVTQGGLRENMAFLIEPDLGRVSERAGVVCDSRRLGFAGCVRFGVYQEGLHKARVFCMCLFVCACLYGSSDKPFITPEVPREATRDGGGEAGRMGRRAGGRETESAEGVPVGGFCLHFFRFLGGVL